MTNVGATSRQAGGRPEEGLPAAHTIVRLGGALDFAAGLSTIDGVVIDPQPPQVNLFHAHFAAPPAALTAARDQIASEDGAWLAQRIGPGDTPGWSSTEIYVGDNLLSQDNSTVVPLFAKLLVLAHSHARSMSLRAQPRMPATT